MNTALMDAQFVLDFYHVFLTLLVWLLGAFATLWILVSLILLFLDRNSVVKNTRFKSSAHV